MLHGGPGGPGGLRAGEMALAVRWSRSLNRDIVVYDQRGAGFSEPRLCPEVMERSLSVGKALAAECVASLMQDGVEPGFYNTSTNVADLIDLRTVLGYKTWDLYGISYGSRLAQEAMRRDPTAVRSVVLASPVMPGMKQAENALSFQRVLEGIFAECAAQPGCRAAFPSPEQDLYALYDELTAKPIELIVNRNGSSETVRLDGRMLLRSIQGRGFSTTQIDRLPLLLHELRRGDRQTAARALIPPVGGVRNVSNALTMLVNCYDWFGATYRQATAAVKSQLRAPFQSVVDDGEPCTVWVDRFADPSEHALVRSDIPALILTHQFDDRTTTEHGRRIAAALEHAYLFELPALGHAQMPAGCLDSIVFGFLKDPTLAPDGTCTAAMRQLAFETSRLERPLLFFSIASPQAAHPFSGRWEAPFPGAPREFDFDLTVRGGSVSGAIKAGAMDLPIFDGVVDAQTLTFKVMSPDGSRTITFRGKLDGDQISFARDVVVRPGGGQGGAGLWGTAGAMTFTARRAQ
jgi:pimeloyl-ACP methyl ester carboxylesterase